MDIPEGPTPLAPLPGEDVTPEQPAPAPDADDPITDLPDEEVPKADVPKTGDASLLWLALSGLSGAGSGRSDPVRPQEKEQGLSSLPPAAPLTGAAGFLFLNQKVACSRIQILTFFTKWAILVCNI